MAPSIPPPVTPAARVVGPTAPAPGTPTPTAAPTFPAARTLTDLTRVGRRLGEHEGTTPDDDPQLSRHRRQARAEGLEQGRAEGLEQGRAESIARERTVLVRLAARKFGAPTAERMAEFLVEVEDPDRLTKAGDLLFECADADDLLSRLS